jgi:DNA-binding transcriptional MerR regulator
MSKSAEAFRTIREVADWLGVPTHVLRFWESKFETVNPVKGPGGRRYYRPDDMRLLGGIRVLLHDQGMTIRGVQKMLSEDGTGPIEALSPEPAFEDGQSRRSTRRGANRREMKEGANAGGTGQGGLYDLDALAEDDSEAPMIHVEAAPVEAEILSFSNALEEGPSPQDAVNAPVVSRGPEPEPPEPEPEPDVTPAVAPEPEVIQSTPPSDTPELPFVAPAPEPEPIAAPAPPAPAAAAHLPAAEPSEQIAEHAQARRMSGKAAAKRARGSKLSGPTRTRVAVYTRRIRSLADRIDAELKS